jgi:hypothetical protein
MMNGLTTKDPWEHMVSLLLPRDECSAVGTNPTGGNPRFQDPYCCASTEERANVTVTLVERASETCAKIAWSDPTRCCYGDQVWRAARARRSGVCVLSGEPIRRGDDVFRPSPGRQFIVNGNAMILASALRHST